MSRGWAGVPLLIALGIGTCAVVFILIDQLGLAGAGAVALGGLGLMALTLLPNHWLPSIALVLFALVPRRVFAYDPVLNMISPALMVMLLWYVRSWSSRVRSVDVSKSPRIGSFGTSIVAGLTIWVVFSLLALSGLRFDSISFTVSFLLTCILILTVPDVWPAVRVLQNTWMVSAVVLTGFCLLEFLLQANPIYDAIYASLGQPGVQGWSVYRASAGFGHPLYAGLYFAMAFGIAFGRRFEGGKNKFLVIAAISAAGVVLTVSRNAIGAVIAAAAVIIVPSLFSRSTVPAFVRVGIAILAAAGLIFAVQSSLFQERSESNEAASSSQARSDLIVLALRVAESTSWLGAGPGSANYASQAFNTQQLYIENGYLQVLISLGVPGLILFVAFLGGGMILAIRRRNFSGLGALVAYAFSVGFFNIFESNQPALLLLGLALLMTWRINPAPVIDGAVQDVGEGTARPARQGLDVPAPPVPASGRYRNSWS